MPNSMSPTIASVTSSASSEATEMDLCRMQLCQTRDVCCANYISFPRRQRRAWSTAHIHGSRSTAHRHGSRVTLPMTSTSTRCFCKLARRRQASMDQTWKPSGRLGQRWGNCGMRAWRRTRESGRMQEPGRTRARMWRPASAQTLARCCAKPKRTSGRPKPKWTNRRTNTTRTCGRTSTARTSR
ncbi:hypothetical protein BD626DRAFT_28051 [Schizophyllum amplum]|uniref:Uncharacterized protein n=1 Tax=Schizophyllum amplum TaxID=97359 RepID=A0A550D040_9AGAR|nr:hypothetical protein BD626DRAFT_28051 [Auriculariopsis ampla]